MSAVDMLLPDLERKPWGFVALVVNILVVGLGSIICGFKARHAITWIVGLVLLVGSLAIFGLGSLAGWGVAWLLSVAHGVVIFLRSA